MRLVWAPALILLTGCVPQGAQPGSAPSNFVSASDSTSPTETSPSNSGLPTVIRLDGKDGWVLDSERVVVVAGRQVQRFVVPTMEQEAKLSLPASLEHSPNPWTADVNLGGQLFALQLDGEPPEVGIWNLETDELRALSLPQEGYSLSAVNWSRDGRALIAEVDEQSIVRWSVDAWDKPAWVMGWYGSSCALSADGRRLALFGEEPGELVVHDFPSAGGEVQTSRVFVRAGLEYLRLSPDGSLLLGQHMVHEEDKNYVSVWDLDERTEILHFPFAIWAQPYADFGPDRTLLLHEEGALVLRDLEGRELERYLLPKELSTHPGISDKVAISKDRVMLVVGEGELNLYVWDR